MSLVEEEIYDMKDYKYNTLTEHFIRDTCTPTNLWVINSANCVAVV